ncbi:hypothetical protein EU538_00405 [Candidatus Thorarchaeota archaeon]|jgi:hypothetical protein|nr:MAG: hypothetical protein EU538_00405 [Candidatus Thorarchaeota archaeon]
MESSESSTIATFSAETIRHLIGGMGIELLSLIQQGCVNDYELKRYSSITQGCLDVKIPLLKTLSLLTGDSDGYEITALGETFLQRVLGWED